MKPRVLGSLFVIALLLAFGAIAAACRGNGDGELTLKEYFQKTDAIFEDAGERIAALDDPGEQEFASEEQQIEAIRDFLDADRAITEDVLDELENIDPPVEVQEAHNEFQGAGVALVALFKDVAAQLANVGSTSEVDRVFTLNAPEINAAYARADAACFLLQGVANANGVDVDLECGPPSTRVP